MIDSERLIMLIEQNQSLWNPAIYDYHNKNLKEASWNSICQELIEDWSTLCQEEKIYKLNDIKKRWNNIRDYYKKEVQLQKNAGTSSTGKKRKKYVFARILEFLRPVLERKNTDDINKNAVQEPEISKVITITAATSSISTPAATTSSTTPPHPRVTKKRSVKKRKVIAFENKSRTPDATGSRLLHNRDDPDLLFLKSLLPDFRILTRGQKIDFKIGIMKLLRSIRTSSTDSPPNNLMSRTGTSTYYIDGCDSSNEEAYVYENTNEEYPNIDESEVSVELETDMFSDLIQIKNESDCE